nr:piggyBac transposable element-derived protein 4-like [Lytechinus pictus]
MDQTIEERTPSLRQSNTILSTWEEWISPTNSYGIPLTSIAHVSGGKNVFALLEVSFCNAVIILRALNAGRPVHLKRRIEVNKVRLSIITGLLRDYERPQAILVRPRMVDGQPLQRLTQKHFPSTNQKRKPNNKPVFRDCEVCSDRDAKRHQTSTVCRDCGNVALCDKPCFRIYHTEQRYKRACTEAFHLEIDDADADAELAEQWFSR